MWLMMHQQSEENIRLGTHVKIISWDDLKDIGYPDYFVLFAWPFHAEIAKKDQNI